ncbi:unnamed protein product, partial [Staurois parvus]
MRCPWYLFHRLFLSLGKDTGPHDTLLPGGPMSCQSAPAHTLPSHVSKATSPVHFHCLSSVHQG